MKQKERILVHDSWKIQKNELYAELVHQRDGIVPGTCLTSETSGLKWKVKYRIMYFHFFDDHTKFPGEIVIVTRKFSKIKRDDIEQLVAEITANEAKDIFLYHLVPVSHEKRPDKGEVLIIAKED